MTRTVLCGGYSVLDVVSVDRTTWQAAGGTAANVAANLAYLGWSSALIARLGADAAGRAVKAHLKAAHVSTKLVELDETVTTPIVIHEITAPNHRYRFGCAACGRGSAYHRPARIPANPRLADVFFFDRPTKANLDLAFKHRDAGRKVVYEPSTKATVGAHRKACETASVVKYSSQRSDEVIERLPARRAEQIWIETLGEEGADVTTDMGVRRITPPEVSSVDAGGAGDWMTAALIYRLYGGAGISTTEKVIDAVAWASSVAALGTMVPGARTLSTVVPRDRLAARLRSVDAGRHVLLGSERPPGPKKGGCRCCGLPLNQD